jgi:hypothetical protein
MIGGSEVFDVLGTPPLTWKFVQVAQGAETWDTRAAE